MHDNTNYGIGFTYRGNPTQTTGLIAGNTQCYAYDTAGVVYQTVDGAGKSVVVATDSTTSYSLPAAVTPNGNSQLNTTMSYASSSAATSLTAPGTSPATVTYDSYGRPSQSQIPDGAVTTYTYTYNPPTQTATVTNQQDTQAGTTNPRWKKTTLDGFGRVIQVDSGHDSVSDANTVSRVVTQYAPCACSPLLKVWRVSQPYNPSSGSPVWTTYTYDGSGRTLTVTAPDGASTTTTTYAGNSTTVTDPAGRWKTSASDAFGNLTLVTEPNPAGGNWTTSYTYNALNQLTQVSMTRPQGTQTRSFVYTGADMTSATNPENGTVTYAYDNAHHVTARTDALGQRTQYTYDIYGRLTQVSHGTMSGTTFNEDLNQQVTYTYGSADGRLWSVDFGRQDNQGYSLPITYSYMYNTAGRVTSQTMAWGMYNPGSPGSPSPRFHLVCDSDGLRTVAVAVCLPERDEPHHGEGLRGPIRQERRGMLLQYPRGPVLHRGQPRWLPPREVFPSSGYFLRDRKTIFLAPFWRDYGGGDRPGVNPQRNPARR